VVVDVRRFSRGRFRKSFMHLVLAHDILPNNTSAIRPILAPSVQQLGRGRAPSSPITDGTDYLRTVRPELGRDYQNPVRTAWTAVRTGLWRTLTGARPEVRATLRRTMPDIAIEIRWCPAHEAVERNEKADEWDKLAADEPDALGEDGLEWLTYSDRLEERLMPLPRSLANIKREVAEKKWAEARKWAGGRTSKKK